MDDAATLAAPALPVVEVVLATALVLALLLATSWFLRRRGPRTTGKGTVMAIETRLALGDRRSLAIVSVDGRRLLIGIAPGQVCLVADLSGPPVAPGVGR